MKARLYIVLCIAFITQMAGVLPLQAGHYYYKQISLKEGLPSTVRCILTDEQGFVWIGTRSGLGRFDGHELKKYIHHADDPHSLPHDLVLQIAEDEQYNIWILTDKGVARYQRQSDDFYLPTDEKGKNITAYSTCPTPEGLLFGAKNKIYFYSYRDGSFRLLQEFDQTPDFRNFNITILSLWDEETVLCCSRWQGLLLLNLKTGAYSRPPFDCGKEIMSMIIDSKNRIWIAPYNNGLYCFDRNGKQTGIIHHPQLLAEQQCHTQPCRTGEQTMDRNGRRRYQHPRTGNRTAFPAGTHPRQRQLFAPRQLHPQPLQRP